MCVAGSSENEANLAQLGLELGQSLAISKKSNNKLGLSSAKLRLSCASQLARLDKAVFAIGVPYTINFMFF